MMGDVQDLEVLSMRLAKWAGKEQKRTGQLKPALEELDRQKEKAIAIFMNSAHKVHSFWKVEPRQH